MKNDERSSRPGRITKHNQADHSLADVAIPVLQHDIITWYDSERKVRRAVPGRALLEERLDESQRARTGAHYAGQPNYHCLYRLSRLDKHVWCESLFEKTAALWLDFREGLLGFASQPMLLQFRDGTSHYPDFFAVHADGRQVVYDVKAQDRITEEFRMQVSNTMRICLAVGWDYQLFTEIDRYVKANLEWLAAYRSLRYAPDDVRRHEILDRFGESRRFGEAIELDIFDSRAEGTRMIGSLMWTHDLRFSMDWPLSPDTAIWRTT